MKKGGCLWRIEKPEAVVSGDNGWSNYSRQRKQHEQRHRDQKHSRVWSYSQSSAQGAQPDGCAVGAVRWEVWLGRAQKVL